MRRIFPILLLSGILMFTACEGDNRGNNNSDDYEAVSAVSAEAPEASTENEETSEPPAVSEEPSEEESSGALLSPLICETSSTLSPFTE